MSWAEQRRADRVAAAEQKRLDADAASARRVREREALAAQQRQDARERAEQEQAERNRRRSRRDASVVRLRRWAAGHVVDVLIYPAVLVAFAMAGPSMAAYGAQVYGSALGWLLPGISELLMLAFAVAVLLARRSDPARPVVMLQAGVWVFAALSAGLNFLHGAERGWSAGVVMAIVAVSGIVAHQLTLATPPRPAADRAAARLARREARKVARVRRAAVRQAVAEIDADGTARLVYRPGRYVLARHRRLARPMLTEAVLPALPVDPGPAGVADWDAALAELLDGTTPPADQAARAAEAAESGGGVGTLDRAGDQQESTPRRPDRPRPVRGRTTRSLEQLRAELRAAAEADPPRVDPSSAQSIRKALRCSAARARQLRDDYQGGRQ